MSKITLKDNGIETTISEETYMALKKLNKDRVAVQREKAKTVLKENGTYYVKENQELNNRMKAIGMYRDSHSTFSALHQKNIELYEEKIKELEDTMQTLKIENKKLERKNRRNDRTVYKEIREALYVKQEGKCYRCGKKMEYKDMHMHHRKKRSEGGSNLMRNLELDCEKCHGEEHRGESVYNLLKET